MLAGKVLSPGSGPMPLILLMLVTSAATVVSALWVIRRERVLQRS
jgi:DHA1 family bicyclomycin/chloramphenicol resistance-like MFS transporter